jgi:hypothetical protein
VSVVAGEEYFFAVGLKETAECIQHNERVQGDGGLPGGKP